METNVLPPKYKRVEYLQTVGTESYIDTGVAGDDDTIQMDFTLEALSKGSYANILGNHDTEDKTCWRFIQGGASFLNRFNLTLNYRMASGSPSLTITELDTIVNHKIQIHMEYEYAYALYNGTKYDVVQSTTAPAEKSTLNIAIGRASPQKTGSSTAPSHRFYDSFKIHKQGKLIRNYIPCYRKSDNKSGFYDIVNHTFNPSTGASDFILPS